MKPLQPLSVLSPGSLGLNLQDSSVTLESGFALEAWNCVIDRQGRLASRKGYTALSAASGALGSAPLKSMYEFVKSDGVGELLSAGNNKLFRGTLLLQDISPAAYTITDSNWVFASLLDRCYLFQNGQEPLIYADIGSGYVMTKMTSFPGYVAPSIGVFWNKIKTGISALGRIWCADDQVVYFSDLRNGQVWNTGTSGSLNVFEVWPDGTDTIQALAVHNNFLIIFGRKNILVYSNANDPARLFLEDTIVGTGCLSQQTVQGIGNDLLFLSENGLRSFSRVIQEQSLPMRDVSKNVRDDFLDTVFNENINNVRSVYFESEAFYLLLVPSIKQVWCFDTRVTLQDGSLRVTRWDNAAFSSFASSRSRLLYLGIPGAVALYFGYADGTTSYTMRYRSNFFDFGSASTTVIPKKLSMVAVSNANQTFVFKWGYDYSPALESEAAVFEGESVSEYGIAEYGIGTYSSGETLGDIEVNTTGDGSVFQVGFDTDISGARVSVQKFSAYVKQGRII